MLLKQRIVTKLPLDELWTDSVVLSFKRKNYLTEHQVLECLLSGKVSSVIADGGQKLSWVTPDNALKVFKAEIRHHIANDPDVIHLKQFEGEWCYLASWWADENGESII